MTPLKTFLTKQLRPYQNICRETYERDVHQYPTEDKFHAHEHRINTGLELFEELSVTCVNLKRDIRIMTLNHAIDRLTRHRFARSLLDGINYPR